MEIQYLHASRFGNGAAVAEDVRARLAARGAVVRVHHIKEVTPDALPAADLYVFSAPGRIGKPVARMRRFVEKLGLPAGTRYAVLTTEMAPAVDKTTGQRPSDDEAEKVNRVLPLLLEALDARGLTRVAAGRVYVTGPRGPLEDGWRDKTAAFVESLPA